MFTKKGCPHCAELKDLLAGLKVKYEEHVVSEMDNYGNIVAALERETGLSTAPNLFIGGKHIGGNDTAQALHKKGDLVKILTQAGVDVAVAA
jgi:glutaredoxin